MHGARARGASTRFRGVMSGFREQLSSLTTLINSADCSFVRCIKPNEHETAGEFDCDLVSTQLAAAGVLEAVRVARSGYAVRMYYDVFCRDFDVLLNLATNAAAQRDAWASEVAKQRAVRLVAACGLAGGRIGYGRTKIFLAAEVYHEMRTARTALQASYALKMQALGRGRLGRARARARQAEAIEEQVEQRKREQEAEAERLRLEQEAKAAEAAAAEASEVAARAAERAATAQAARLAAARRTAEALTNGAGHVTLDSASATPMLERGLSGERCTEGGMAALVLRASATNMMVDKMRQAVEKRRAAERASSGSRMNSPRVSSPRAGSPRFETVVYSQDRGLVGPTNAPHSPRGGTVLTETSISPGNSSHSSPRNSKRLTSASVRPLSRTASASGSAKFVMALGFEPPPANAFARRNRLSSSSAQSNGEASSTNTSGCSPPHSRASNISPSPSPLGIRTPAGNTSEPVKGAAGSTLNRKYNAKFFGMTPSLSTAGFSLNGRHSIGRQSAGSSIDPDGSAGRHGCASRLSTDAGVDEIDLLESTRRDAGQAQVNGPWGSASSSSDSADEGEPEVGEMEPSDPDESPSEVRLASGDIEYEDAIFRGHAQAGATEHGGLSQIVLPSESALGDVSEQERQGIVEYAAYLGMDPEVDAHLLWIARDALHAPVPKPWIEGLDMRGRLYYYNSVTEETFREHPMDEYYRLLYLEATGGHHSCASDDMSATLSVAGSGVASRRSSVCSELPGGKPLPSPREWARMRWLVDPTEVESWEDISAHVYDDQQRAPLPLELSEPARLQPPPADEADGEVGALTGTPPPAPGGLPWSPFSRDWRSIRRAMYTPPWHPGMMHGFVRRVKVRSHVRYDLYLELPGHVLHLASARKLLRSMTAYYCLSIDKDSISRDSSSYLGKLRASSVGGTGWQLFDNGLSAKDAADEASLCRRQLMAVHFQKNIMGSRGPSRLACVVPSTDGTSDSLASIPSIDATEPHGGREVSLVTRWLENDRAGLTLLVNKPPIWSEELGTYTLEYNGRATLASVKNIQLIHEGNEENLIFQMGKVSDTRFNIDFKAPFSPVQAFALALTVFDSKLAASAAPSTLRAARRVRERVLAGVPSMRVSGRMSGRATSRRSSEDRENRDSSWSCDSSVLGSHSPGESSPEFPSPDASRRESRWRPTSRPNSNE